MNTEERMKKVKDEVELYARNIAINFLHWHEYPELDIDECTKEFDAWHFNHQKQQ
jgi:hypothetical protein